MIELRWIDDQGGLTLQWREGKAYYLPIEDDDQGREQFSTTLTWEGSDWINVPVVKKKDADK